MKKRLLLEVPFMVLIVLPVLYLANVWESIPETVPLHYNLFGEADRWGDKEDLLLLVTLVPTGCYLILLLAEFIDPKQQISSMGGKFYQIRMLLSLTLGSIVLLMSYSLANQKDNFESYVFIIIGLLFVLFGNYFRNLKPNYFIGFRTPWTLESETVWRDTHQRCSVIWFSGGLLLTVVNCWQPMHRIWFFNTSVIMLLILTPIIYSFLRYRTLSKASNP